MTILTREEQTFRFPAMNTLAVELNTILDENVAGRLLSSLGKRLYFPKGIIAQSAEAKKFAHRANATIGMAYEGGRPLILSAIAEGMPTLSALEAVAYAPTAGVETVRSAWKESICEKNPTLDPEGISLPVVVPGLTGGISYIADLFLDETTDILISDPSWDNYPLIFKDRRGSGVTEVPFFGKGTGLNLPAIREAIHRMAKTGKVRLILNFPNNPSGYSPTTAEAMELVNIIKEVAEKGADVLVICDDAYFGLAYEPEIYGESLFGPLSKLHERVLAVKIDGPTKEDYVWGLRMGFVTFGCKGMTQETYEALVKKLMGAIRSSVSCSNTPAQYFMLKTMADPRSKEEKARFKSMLQRRYQAVKQFLSSQGTHPVLQALPFNSGYFMCFVCTGVSAEEIRQKLLKEEGIGTIALGDRYLRFAFSSVEEHLIPETLNALYRVASSLAQSKKG
jgi:aspartate/methionine/tyrosine aminotransferase